MKRIFTFLLPLLFLSASFRAQPANDTVIFTQLGHFYYDTVVWRAAYSPLIDRLGRPYVYTASVDLGMVTFDINDPMNPVPVDTIRPADLNGYKATFLAQDADTLFITTGGFQGFTQRAGLSIYDVTNPATPVLMDHWDTAAWAHGVSHIVLDGDYAFLSAMNDGIIVLNISDKHNIRFVSHFVPTTTPNTSYAPHTRGLYLDNDTLIDADDGGGLRIIDATDKQNLVQIGAYLNPVPHATDTVYPFYNHVWCIGKHAWIPVDYAGIEVDDYSNPASITTDAWSNIWNNTGISSWYGSDGHTNEIVYTGPTTNVLMVSGADSQVLAFDPSDPANPRIMGWWGPPNTDNEAAWGVDEFNGLVVCGYLRDVGSNQPYYSTYGGIQLLSWNLLVTGENDNSPATSTLMISPNPTNDKATVALPASTDELFTINLIDVTGRVVQTQSADPKMNGRNAEIDMTNLAPGIYTVCVHGKTSMWTGKVVKE
ncbi:MAG TPA: T9SS type A sorting domain-containing protein [Bacteroidia bacterium]|nr:T9SS type A sorting domain-containing protein [Bacteroidia bacterium]